MTSGSFIHKSQKLIVVVLAILLPLSASSAKEEVMHEKRVEVAMRMIGHEILMSLGDSSSRVMPIEEVDGQYRIPFEFDFGFDPGDLIAIVERVMAESGVATDYLVEVEQCETKQVVHSFVIRTTTSSDLTPCGGRALPVDCYSLLVTIQDDTTSVANALAATSGSSSLTSLATEKASPLRSVLLFVPFLLLIGLIEYVVRKMKPADIDPNLILIGASRFDKKHMALSYKDSRIELSNKEADLLSVLHDSVNAPIEREVILQRVWGDEGDYVGRTLDVFISKLRKKLEADASVKIVNVRGVGYKLVVGNG
jgi:hypothetical protein